MDNILGQGNDRIGPGYSWAVPADEKRVYIASYRRQCGGTRLGLIFLQKKLAESAGKLLKNTNIS